MSQADDILDICIKNGKDIKMKEEELLRKLKKENQNSAFAILNTSSEENIFYKMNGPFQVTYECCSGTAADDYINICTFSPEGSSYQQESVELHNYIYHYKAPHFHNYYEFLLVLGGAVCQQIEGTEYLYPEGTACLINRNLRHKEIFRQPSQILFLGFSPDHLMEMLYGTSYYPEESAVQNTELCRFIQDDLASPGRKAYLDFTPAFRNKASAAKLHETVEILLHATLLPQFGASRKIDSCFCDLFCNLTSPDNYHCSVIELENSSDYLLFSRVEHLLEENNGRLSREDLSNVLHYSGDYLNRIVHKYTGLSLHRYGVELCIKKAAHELLETTDSVSDIADRLFFTNRSYFYKLFEETYGMTPKEFQNRQ